VFHGWCFMAGVSWLVFHGWCFMAGVSWLVFHGWCFMAGVSWLAFHGWHFMAVPVSGAVRLGGARHANPRRSLTASASEFKHPPGKAVAKIARPIKGFASVAAV
jgi:hypothetical protein